MFKKGLLIAAFAIAVDFVVASLTGLTGIHAYLVEGGAMIGDALNIPPIDWGGILEFFGFSDFAADAHLHHDHGAFSGSELAHVDHTGHVDHLGHNDHNVDVGLYNEYNDASSGTHTDHFHGDGHNHDEFDRLVESQDASATWGSPR